MDRLRRPLPYFLPCTRENLQLYRPEFMSLQAITPVALSSGITVLVPVPPPMYVRVRGRADPHVDNYMYLYQVRGRPVRKKSVWREDRYVDPYRWIHIHALKIER